MEVHPLNAPQTHLNTLRRALSSTNWVGEVLSLPERELIEQAMFLVSEAQQYNQRPKLKLLDLFSGIGGFSLGLERTGFFQTIGFSEIEPFCCKVLKKHWPEVPNLGDVIALAERAEEFKGKVDAICGGFPCQDISVAGKQRGMVDEELKKKLIEEGLNEEAADKEATTRSGLWFYYKTIIEKIQPEWVVIENVANLRSRGLTRVLQDLRALGYVGEAHVIPAAALGAPHLRERLWIVAHHNSVAVRNLKQRTEEGRHDLPPEGEARTGDHGPVGSHSDGAAGTPPTHTTGSGLQDQLSSGPHAGLPEVEQPGRTNPKHGARGHKRDRNCVHCYAWTPSNTDLPGRERQDPPQPTRRGDNNEPSWVGQEGTPTAPDTNHLRLWEPIASEEEASRRWAEGTLSLNYWIQTEPPVCGVDDGFPTELDGLLGAPGQTVPTPAQKALREEVRKKERTRKLRLHALGNAIVPQIATLLGLRIAIVGELFTLCTQQKHLKQ